MSDFDPKWPHGHERIPGNIPARVICDDAKGGMPIVALIDLSGGEVAFHYLADGTDGASVGARIINAPAPKRRHVRWVNMYPDRQGTTTHGEKSRADLSASFDRIACIRIEFEEGEGL